MDADEPTASERLEDALHDVIAILVPVIGLPPTIPAGDRIRPDGMEPLIDREHVPASALFVVEKALDYVALGLAVLEGAIDTPVGVEEGLAILAHERRQHTAPANPAPPC